MAEETLISVENVSKKFCRSLKKSLWYGLQDIGAEILGSQARREALRDDEFWSVKDISFELKRGECLGLIGPNGAGKSSLLKLLNGLIRPDMGRIRMHGRIGALIELGVGFNPILTGRENVHINGSILGFSKQQIKQKMDEIVDFSEINEFIDTPVQNYSSGMRVRLGFAIAVQMEPDILLIDEVLAVGDVGFRMKCFNKIFEINRNAAIILVSHSMPQIAKVCGRAAVMEKGNFVYHGNDVGEGINIYNSLFSSVQGNTLGSGVNMDLYQFYTDTSEEYNDLVSLGYLEDLCLKLRFSVDKKYKRYDIVLGIADQDARYVAATTSDVICNRNDMFSVNLKIPNMMLSPGRYTATLTFHEVAEDGKGRRGIICSYKDTKSIEVAGGQMKTGVPFTLFGEWGINEVN